MPREPEVVDPIREKEELGHQGRDDRHGQDHAEDEKNGHLPKLVQPRRSADETLHDHRPEHGLRRVSAELDEHDHERHRALKVAHEMQVHGEQCSEVQPPEPNWCQQKRRQEYPVRQPDGGDASGLEPEREGNDSRAVVARAHQDGAGRQREIR